MADFMIRRRFQRRDDDGRLVYSRHPSWVLYFNGKRVAAYQRWESALGHAERAVQKFGRGYL